MSRRTKSQRDRAERDGRRGERLAELFLLVTGWRVLARRVKTPRGEVDIVARRGRTLCFVEVKWRRTKAELDTAISLPRLRRVAAAAEALAPRFAKPGDAQRVDVMLIAPGCWPRRIVNAWQPGS
ncbi:putative endonuclease [Novosphingobium sp. CF614]|uniref:YraN family protein n=1 Tax=Novosphingobium sp. CF614 TaxID=1884364 RepID=UPI0008EE7A7D|nr:YraN family protein [Novosphingobium sp. CF614]SFF94332.1 putative endonuclease [Novosphingobium sp. CF614]